MFRNLVCIFLSLEEMLFRYSTIRQPSFSLSLDGESGLLVLLHCNASRKPKTGVNSDHEFFLGNFNLTMDCMVEHPTDQHRMETILEPYLNVALLFATTGENTELQDTRTVEYGIEVTTPFTFLFLRASFSVTQLECCSKGGKISFSGGQNLWVG